MAFRVAQFVPTISGAGAERLTVELACALSRRSHRVVVIEQDAREDGGDGGGEAELRMREEAETRLRAHGVELLCLERRRGGMSPAVVLRARRAIRDHGFDVMHSHHPLTCLLVQAARGIVGGGVHVTTVHSMRRARFRLLGALRRRVEAEAFVSDATRMAHEPSSRISVVVENGCDVGSFRRALERRGEMRRMLDVPEGQRVLISVGGLRPQKNHESIIDACAILREQGVDFRCLIVGAGGLRESLEARARSAGVREQVVLYGASGRIAELLAAADVYIGASTVETFGIAALEACASGLPCVLTPCAGFGTFAAEMPGCFTCAGFEGRDIARGVRQCMEAAPRRDELLGSRGPVLERYSMDRVAADYERVYESAMALRRRNAQAVGVVVAGAELQGGHKGVGGGGDESLRGASTPPLSDSWQTRMSAPPMADRNGWATSGGQECLPHRTRARCPCHKKQEWLNH